MPGFLHWPLDAAFVQIAEARITRMICLEEAGKMLDRSPGYFGAVERGETPAPVTWHPVVDYGVPEDLEAYLSLVREIAGGLRAGERILVHCAGGCGRSGTFASLVLVALGMEPGAAEAVYRKATGCGPESDVQRALVRRGLAAG